MSYVTLSSPVPVPIHEWKGMCDRSSIVMSKHQQERCVERGTDVDDITAPTVVYKEMRKYMPSSSRPHIRIQKAYLISINTCDNQRVDMWFLYKTYRRKKILWCMTSTRCSINGRGICTHQYSHNMPKT